MKNLNDFLKEKESNTFSVPEQKKLLRKRLLNLREEQHKSAKPEDWGPRQFFRTLDLLKVRSLKSLEKKYIIACFFPIQHELDIASFANEDWIFPCMQKDKTLKWFQYGDGKTGYKLNKHGIKEREEEFCFSYSNEFLPMLCFVPGLAAARDGSRLGYGGGYYDKFLSEFKEKITSVLCLPTKDFTFDQLPCEEFDEKVDLIVF